MVSMEEWETYTNLRALLSNAGSTLYPGDFQHFTPFEIRNYSGLYMLQGLSPSPQVKQKFQPLSVDPINGSDLCFNMFGKNANKRHKIFKAFFTIQDPHKSIPLKATYPNFKLILSYIGYKQCQWWHGTQEGVCPVMSRQLALKAIMQISRCNQPRWIYLQFLFLEHACAQEVP